MKIAKWNFLLTSGMCLLLTAGAMSQSPVAITADQRKTANEVYTARVWAKSVELYQAITEVEPGNAGALFRLGVSYHQLKKYDQAMEAYLRSEKINVNGTVRYNIACIHSIKGEQTTALEWLDKAIVAGFNDLATFKNDSDLSAIRDTTKFKLLEERIERAVRPCAHSPEARQFDFWIGEWDVRTPQGIVAGSSSVQSILGQCIVFENWSALGGNSGKSFNIYDKNDKKWHQTWVDDKGTFTHYIGGLLDGKMVFVADTTVADKRSLARMTFSKLANGDVRQFGENSTDEGKTWTAAFDLIYHLRKKNLEEK